MNRAPTNERTRVEPSTRDPIASWLDVFVGLLNLPKDQKRTIRDELEDHLRSRVDDLLITGITESEATQRAVAELGETAELAKSFRAAARPSHTRRLIMTASICTILGAATVIGLSTVTGSALNANHAANSAMVSTQSDTIEVRGRTYSQLFAEIDAQTDQPLLVHWDRLGEIGLERETEIGLDVGPLPKARIRELLAEKAEYEFGDPLAFVETPELIEITTRDHLDARTTDLRTYDVRDLIEMRTGYGAAELFDGGESSHWRGAAEGVFESIVMMSEPELWSIMGGESARGQLIGASLMIDAPERLHERVEFTLAAMREDADRTRVLAKQQLDRAAAERHQRIEAAKSELTELAARYAHLRSRCERLDFDRNSADNSDQMEALTTELTMLEVERDLAERRVRRVSELIVDLESEASKDRGRASLGKGRRGAAATPDANTTDFDYVRGDVARPGVTSSR